VKDWQRRTVLVAALALCGSAAYLPAVPSGWVWDDVNLVQPSPALQDLGGLRRAVATDLYRQAAPRLEASPYWRPLALASYWLDTRLGAAPRALHIGNIFLHGLATALLALVLLRRRRDGSGLVGPALAATWWTFHPDNVETIAWISCRYELLSGVALLGLLALPWRPGMRRAALYGLLFLAGLLSKDGFGAMLVVVVAMDWAERRAPAVAARRWVAIGSAVAAWWGGNLTMAGQFPVRLSNPKKLVYSAHDYGMSVSNQQRWFLDPTFPATLQPFWESMWGYLVRQNIAPVLLGEFGSTLADPRDSVWMPALLNYVQSLGMSWTYWSLTPTRATPRASCSTTGRASTTSATTSSTRSWSPGRPRRSSC
jgi:hypothetical protein